ncbi:DUF742 domain-containing protein [Streptomyces montanisoli]|uniref:DUF742 domain-containing protein n=1 Tax=Streptomyces montanisoli TaxID=2798581 RepID=A0A940MH88_9ACTN|nr:DUF742 domain-containing protein [Streptomyces montanisoli]MBP0459582.1 DUF742 domain-containing protein [Streptomyces montanisoli]
MRASGDLSGGGYPGGPAGYPGDDPRAAYQAGGRRGGGYEGGQDGYPSYPGHPVAQNGYPDGRITRPGAQGGYRGMPSEERPEGAHRAPMPPQGPFDRPRHRIEPVAPRRAPEPTREPVGPHNPLVRPYAMTGGRTRPRYQLAMEALVSTTAELSALHGQLPEHQRICRLCLEVKSVAEISALLSIPLGVTRILVADLAEAGLVAIHQPGGDESAGGQPDVTLLERVLSGLRKL